MTKAEAVKEARRRWGASGTAYRRYVELINGSILITCYVGITERHRTIRRGEGATFDDAFANASKKAQP